MFSGRFPSRLTLRHAALALLLGLAPAPVSASPWVEVGDATLRSDLELLAAYGLIDNLATTWPVPWAQVARAFKAPTGALPAAVRASLRRVRARFDAAAETGRLRSEASLRATTEPTLVRGFDARARQELDARIGAEYMWSSTALRLNLGLQSDIEFEDAHPTLDGSYLAQEVGNWLLYAGWLDHWWGPGWVGSLILSNNARPFPRVGLMRNDPKAFETPWLSWIGPWQVNAFLGVLEDEFQAVDDPFVAGLRVAVSPFSWLELGASRVLMICGEGRSCDLDTWGNALVGNDNDLGRQQDPSNQLGGVDARLSGRIGAFPVSLYGQYIGEDEAGGLPSRAAGLVGASIAGPVGSSGAQWRVVAEYADTAASVLNQDKRFSLFYEHGTYTTGYRYRGRTIGHTLDNDAQIASVLLALTDARDWTYRLAYHHARLNRDDVARGNRVSASAETVNLVELGVEMVLGRSRLGLDLRLQDDQPDTPEEKDGLVAVEADWTYRW